MWEDAHGLKEGIVEHELNAPPTAYELMKLRKNLTWDPLPDPRG